jgi:hypothetical protein
VKLKLNYSFLLYPGVFILKKLLLVFTLIITLTACSNGNQGADPADDLYLEGVVLEKNKNSVELELFGSSRDITESITVKINSRKKLTTLDEGEGVFVQCDHIVWSKTPETEAVDIYPISLNNK